MIASPDCTGIRPATKRHLILLATLRFAAASVPAQAETAYVYCEGSPPHNAKGLFVYVSGVTTEDLDYPACRWAR